MVSSQRLRINGKFGPQWTKAEQNLLREKYPIAESIDLLALFPNRTLNAIYSMGQMLGLKRPIFHGWKESENIILREMYPKEKKEKILKALPKRKWRLIGSQANKLGVHRLRSGSYNGMWKGGKPKHVMGYTLLYCPKHPRACNNYVLEHIVVWEKAHGKPLPVGYVIHHVNGVRDDNRIENLVAVRRGQHEHDTVVKLLQKRIRELEHNIEVALNE